MSETETTVARQEISKYCNKCKKYCGHWESEHNIIFNST